MKAKLTLADAIQIRVRVRHGEKATDLAREFGVSRGTVTAITQRRTHKISLANIGKRLAKERWKEKGDTNWKSVSNLNLKVGRSSK